MYNVTSMPKGYGLIFICFTTLVCLTFGQEKPCDPEIKGCTCTEKALNCTGEEIIAFPTLDEAKKLSIYNFTNCKLDVILDIPYESAEILEITNCSVKTIHDGAFSNLTKLRELIFKDNPLESLTNSTFSGLTSLVKLELVNDGLVNLPEGFLQAFPALKDIDISENSLKLTDTMFSGAALTLTKFMCMNCSWTNFPDAALQSLPGLTNLCLSRNNLTNLTANMFEKWCKLQVLCLSDCQIEFVHKHAFTSLNSVKTLNLAKNKIKMLEEDTFEPFYDSLKILNLAGNKLESLSEKLARWSNLEKIRLENNPWVCDCNISWIGSYHIPNIDSESATCASPDDLKGQRLYTALHDLKCGSGSSAVTLAILIPVFIICFLLMIYYIRKIMINKRRRHREHEAYHYQSVYGETVEPANSRQHIFS